MMLDVAVDDDDDEIVESCNTITTNNKATRMYDDSKFFSDDFS